MGRLSGANGLLAYEGQEPGDFTFAREEIFTISPHGGEPSQPTNNLVPDSQPSWSADGRRIVFVRLGANRAVWTMNADGQDKHPVAPFPRSGAFDEPYFSPGGHRIVMGADHSIATVRTGGTDLRQLVSGFVRRPEYSPNGSRIVFSGLPDGKGRSGIWTVRSDGSDLRRVTRSPRAEDGYDTSPDWRPNGRRIVYARCLSSSEKGCGDGGTYSVRPDGSGNHLLY